MKKSRFTETQIVAILKEADAGMKVDDICHHTGSGQTPAERQTRHAAHA